MLQRTNHIIKGCGSWIPHLPASSIYRIFVRTMPMLRFLLLILLVLPFVSTTHSQGISVTSFTPLPNDMTARSLNPVRDANGELTALIKVVTTETGFDFTAGSLGIVKVDPQPGEIWVYVPDRSRSMTIRHPQLGVLRNYAYPLAISAGNVYEMQLSHGRVEVLVKPKELVTEWFVISTNPPGADVYIDQQPVGKTPFSAEYPEGKYEWRVERNLYQAEAGVAELKSGTRVSLDLDLKPNFGRVQVESLPENGAKVLLNGIDIGKETPCTLDELPVGSYTLTLSHDWYETKNESFELKAGDDMQLKSELQATFGELVLKEATGISYFVNDKARQDSVVRLAPGVYSVEARKPSHKPARVQVVIERGKQQRPELLPQPMYGNIRIQSQPFGARIFVNGKEAGESPFTLREVLVGEHTVRLSKEGYESIEQKVEVKEDETADVNLKLEALSGDASKAEVENKIEAAADSSTQNKASEMVNPNIDGALLEEIVRSHYKACGGLAGFENIRTYEEDANIIMKEAGIEMNYRKVSKMPDKLKITTSFGGFSTEQILNGKEGVMVSGGAQTPMEPSSVEALKQSIRFTVMMDWIEDPSQVLFVGRRELDGKSHLAIEVENGDSGSITYYFNPENHLLAATEVNLSIEGAQSRTVTWIRAYTQVEGLKFPRKIEMQTGNERMTFEYSSIRINHEVPDSEFVIR